MSAAQLTGVLGFVFGFIVFDLAIRAFRGWKNRPKDAPEPEPAKFVVGGSYLVMYSDTQIVVEVLDVAQDGHAVFVKGDRLPKGWAPIRDLVVLSALSLPKTITGDTRGSYRGES